MHTMDGGVMFLHFWATLLLGQHCVAAGSSYQRQYEATLTALPVEDIPANTVSIQIDNCAIEDFEYFPEFSSCDTVSLAGNRLTVMPDFTNISSTLTHLNLESNNISYIDPERLNALVNVIYLSLNNNAYLTLFPDCTLVGGASLQTLKLQEVPLAEFPDMPCFGGSLLYVMLGGYKFTGIQDSRLHHLIQVRTLSLPDGDMELFPRADVLNNTLKYLGVYNTSITEIPVTHIPAGVLSLLRLSDNEHLTTLPDLRPVLSIATVVELRYLSLLCDCRLLWLLDPAVTAKSDVTGSHCSDPPHLVGVAIDQLDEEDLVCDTANTDEANGITGIVYRKTDAVFPEYLNSVYHGISRTACASRCTLSPECWRFAYHPTAAGGGVGRCGLPGGHTGADSASSVNFTEWFTE